MKQLKLPKEQQSRFLQLSWRRACQTEQKLEKLRPKIISVIIHQITGNFRDKINQFSTDIPVRLWLQKIKQLLFEAAFLLVGQLAEEFLKFWGQESAEHDSCQLSAVIAHTAARWKGGEEERGFLFGG